MDHAIYPTTEDRESWGRRPSGVLTRPAEGSTAEPLFLEGILPRRNSWSGSALKNVGWTV